MRTIHKYKLGIGEKTSLPIPLSSKPLHVGQQDGTVCLWVELNTRHAIDKGRSFFVIGTGWDFGGYVDGSYIGTVQIGDFVWHAYESE